MSDSVNASPEDVKKLARSLDQFEQKILQVCKEAQSAMNGARWHDKQKDAFEARFKDFTSRTVKFAGGETKEMVKNLNTLAHALEQARSVKM